MLIATLTKPWKGQYLKLKPGTDLEIAHLYDDYALARHKGFVFAVELDEIENIRTHYEVGDQMALFYL